MCVVLLIFSLSWFDFGGRLFGSVWAFVFWGCFNKDRRFIGLYGSGLFFFGFGGWMV